MQQPSFQKWGFARAKHQGPWCLRFLWCAPCWWLGSADRGIFAKVLRRTGRKSNCILRYVHKSRFLRCFTPHIFSGYLGYLPPFLICPPFLDVGPASEPTILQPFFPEIHLKPILPMKSTLSFSVPTFIHFHFWAAHFSQNFISSTFYKHFMEIWVFLSISRWWYAFCPCSADP